MTQATQDPKTKLLNAILDHVAFDGWSAESFDAAVVDCGIDPALAAAICPRGALDLAVASHKAGDAAMLAGLSMLDMDNLRYSEKVAALARLRIECAGDKEVVRRATTLFALPHHAPEGGRLIWDTADAIWTALGDTSDDLNWYSKRAILSGVYGSTVLFWLGDTSDDNIESWAFLDRRIENVMQFEKTKAKLQSSPLLGKLMEGPGKVFANIRAPKQDAMNDLPGRWSGETKGH